MACSNFCSSKELDELEAGIGYVSRAEERAQYHAIQKAQAIYEAHAQASITQPPPSHHDIEQLQQYASASPEAALLGVAFAVSMLVEAIATTWTAHKASEM